MRITPVKPGHVRCDHPHVAVLTNDVSPITATASPGTKLLRFGALPFWDLLTESPGLIRALIASVVTTLGNGQVFYMAAVTPQSEYATYQRTFNDILRSLRLSGGY